MPPTADVLVVNTCAFIDSAKQESIDAILEMAQHKKDGACQRLIVTGCLAERYRDELRAEIPEIDAVLGTGEVPEIVGAIGGARRHRRRAADVLPRHALGSRPALAAPGTRRTRHPAPCPTYIYDADTPRLLATPRHYAYVKIAEGLRLQVRVLHHPDAARRTTAAGRPSRSSGSARAGGARRQGAAAHLAGHDLLRHRPAASAARSRGCCAS